MKENFLPYFTILIGIVALAITVPLFFVEVPAINQPVIFSCTGSAWSGFITAISFWLGSSKGSKDKDVLIDNKSEKNGNIN